MGSVMGVSPFPVCSWNRAGRGQSRGFVAVLPTDLTLRVLTPGMSRFLPQVMDEQILASLSCS